MAFCCVSILEKWWRKWAHTCLKVEHRICEPSCTRLECPWIWYGSCAHCLFCFTYTMGIWFHGVLFNLVVFSFFKMQVKKSLCVLVQHGVCVFSSGRRGPGSPTEYRTSCDRILRILRFPRYIYTAKTLYGDTGELIVEELLQRGELTMSSTVKTVADRLTQNMEGGLLQHPVGFGRR